MNTHLLAQGCQQLGVELSDNQISQFSVYLQELLAWNQKFNLTSITDENEIVTKHFLDSLTVTQVIKLSTQKIIDIGSGAGFPGIPLKIVFQNLKLTLLEATRKKTEFLNHIIKILGLDNVEVVWGRGEDFSKKHKAKFDLVVCRAVAKLPELVKYSLPLLKKNGLFVVYKSTKIEDEIKSIQKFSPKIKEVLIPSTDIKRKLVVVEKSVFF